MDTAAITDKVTSALTETSPEGVTVEGAYTDEFLDQDLHVWTFTASKAGTEEDPGFGVSRQYVSQTPGIDDEALAGLIVEMTNTIATTSQGAAA